MVQAQIIEEICEDACFDIDSPAQYIECMKRCENRLKAQNKRQKWVKLRGLWKSVKVSKSGKALLVVGAEDWNRKLKFWIPAKGFRSYAGMRTDYREEVYIASWVLRLKPELKELLEE